jgi:carbamoyl-phosphate synthase large subunit
MAGVNILISSGGRRVGLMACFRETLNSLGLQGRICVADCSATAPAFHLADESWIVPPCTVPEFASLVLEIARKERIGLVAPTIDTELPAYSAARHDFAERGVAVAVSEKETVAICGDKALTHGWLESKGFPTVRQGTPEDVMSRPGEWRFPLIAKPRNGSASLGVQNVGSLRELEVAATRTSDLIVQEPARGTEHTVNVYVDREGRCRCAVPHARLEVRAGEVSKGVTVKNRQLMDLARNVAEELPGAYGPMNIQCFVAPEGEICVIEINARFGGGYPLAHKAGAHFTRSLIEETLDLPISASFDGWQDDLAMLRYDEAVYLPGSRIRTEAHEPVTCHVRH